MTRCYPSRLHPAWLALVGAIVVMLALDLFWSCAAAAARCRCASPSLASVVWVAIAFAFAAVLLRVRRAGRGRGDYVAGYLVEKSLSLDNVFVFLLVFAAFGVAEAERHKLLTYGIIGALVMRARVHRGRRRRAAALQLDRLHLRRAALYTGCKLFRHRHDHDGETELVEKIQKRLPAARPAAPRWPRSRSST